MINILKKLNFIENKITNLMIDDDFSKYEYQKSIIPIVNEEHEITDIKFTEKIIDIKTGEEIENSELLNKFRKIRHKKIKIILPKFSSKQKEKNQ